jgi:hypothetical protein
MLINLFTNIHNKLERFFDKPLQLSLKFVDKAGAYPRVEHLKYTSLG